MKLTPLHLAGAATLLVSGVRARFDLTGVALKAVPSCAQSCFLAGASQVGCGATDYACQCRHEVALYAVVEECVATACETSMYQNVIDGRSLVCKRALEDAGGATVTVSGSLIVIGSGTVGSFTPSGTATTTAATAPTTAATTGSASGTTSLSGVSSQSGSSTSSTAAGRGGGSGNTPTTTAPTYFSTSSVISWSGKLEPTSPWLLIASLTLTAFLFQI